MSIYHDGAEAQSKGVLRHMNPYEGPLTFVESFSLTPKWFKKDEWYRGWDAGAKALAEAKDRK